MYDKIYEFCKVKNLGTCQRNGHKPTPRVNWLLNLLDESGIEYELDTFNSGSKYNDFFNIVMRGDSTKMVVAHHDIVNPASDNANDNSCSVINAIAIKKAMPNINVILLDGEEMGGIGSQRASERINAGDFGKIDWVLNLELTGRGGKYFFIGDYPGVISNHIKSLFPSCPIVHTPYNDSVTFRRNGIDSVVINPIPPKIKKQEPENQWSRFHKEREEDKVMFEGVELDYEVLFLCHSMNDSVDKISTSDMKEFVEEICLKILA